MIDIVITSYFRKEFTEQCLLKLKKYTFTPHRIIVVDNGSDSETTDMLRGMEIDELVLLPDNIGLEPAKNIGLSHVTSDWFVDSDNDILVPPFEKGKDWLQRLLELKDKNPEYAAIACPPQVFIGANKEELFRNKPEVVEWNKCGGSMRLMNTKLVRQVGGWRNEPKDMIEANRSEEWLICGKLKAEGYKVGYARDIGVYHFFGDDKQWGYGNVPHYHKDIYPRPTDTQYGTAEQWYNNFNRS
jgi:glycosyltransferase involved in cell wall biosynthesis